MIRAPHPARLALALIAALCALPGPAQAEEAASLLPPDPLAQAPDHRAAELEAHLAEAEVHLTAGRAPEALTPIFAANDIAIAAGDMDTALRYLPSLYAARAYRLLDDWPEVERFAASTLRAYDAPQFAADPRRIHAAGLLGQALVRQDRPAEAALLLRKAVQDVAAAGPALDPATVPEAALAQFWLAVASLHAQSPDWRDRTAAAIASSDAARRIVTDEEFVPLLHDYLIRERQETGIDDDLMTLSRIMADMAGSSGTHPLDRAAYMKLHADILADMDRDPEALALLEAEIARIATDHSGSLRHLELGGRLALLRFGAGDPPGAIALLRDLIAAAPVGQNQTERAYVMAILGQALDHQGAVAEAQPVFRAAYATLREVLPSHAPMAMEAAALIDPTDPDFAGYAFGAELIDPAAIAPDGPPEAVLGRFLSGLYQQNEAALMGTEHIRPEVEALSWQVNRALHLALSGREAEMLDALAMLGRDSLGDGPLTDRLTIYEGLGVFWLNGRRPQDRPDLYAALQDLTADPDRLPPDLHALVRALDVAILNMAGRPGEAAPLLRDWVAARDLSRRPRSPWDIVAALLATEIGFTLLEPDLAARIMEDSLTELQDHPGFVLAHDYLRLVQLLNAPSAMDTDRGLMDLAALVQRVSAQVPTGHILRATTRFGLASALFARDRQEEGRAMIAEAAAAYRANPTHRRDVLAFMQALEAQSLSIQGHKDLALTLARAAFETLPADARGDYRLSVVSILAWELANDGRTDEARDLSERELSDSAWLQALSPADRIEAIRSRAGILRAAGDLEASARLLDQAASAIAEAAHTPPMTRVLVDWDRGLIDYAAGRMEPAFRAIAASNDGYFTYRGAIAASSASGRAASRGEDQMRARSEAFLGWELYQQMQAGAD